MFVFVFIYEFVVKGDIYFVCDTFYVVDTLLTVKHRTEA